MLRVAGVSKAVICLYGVYMNDDLSFLTVVDNEDSGAGACRSEGHQCRPVQPQRRRKMMRASRAARTLTSLAARRRRHDGL
jgi:hypothetical protein